MSSQLCDYSTTGLRHVVFTYRASLCDARYTLNDLYLIPATSASRVVGLLASPLDQVGASGPSSLPSNPDSDLSLRHHSACRLKIEFHDARCPYCAGKPITTLDGRGASMLRCDGCSLCPRCQTAVIEDRVVSYTVGGVRKSKAHVFCSACGWSSPDFADAQTLSQWLAACCQPLFRSVCSHLGMMPALRSTSQKVSLSSLARESITAATKAGTLPLPSSREERVLQFDAALEQQQSLMIFTKPHHLRSESPRPLLLQPADPRLGHKSMVVKGHKRNKPPQPAAVTPADANSDSDDDSLVPFVVSPLPNCTSEKDWSKWSSKDVALAVLKLGTSSESQVPTLSHVEPPPPQQHPATLHGEGGGPSSPVATSSSSTVVGGAGGDNDVEGGDVLPPVQPMMKASKLPRTVVTAHVPSSSSSPSSRQLIHADGQTNVTTNVKENSKTFPVSCPGSLDAADGISMTFFTNAHSNPLLSTSLNAARFLPHMFIAANVSRTAKADFASRSRRRIFVMLQSLNDEVSVTVKQLRVVGEGNCSCSISCSSLPAEGVPLGSRKRTQVQSARCYVDSKMADTIFVPPKDDTSAGGSTSNDDTVVTIDASRDDGAGGGGGFFHHPVGAAMFFGLDLILQNDATTAANKVESDQSSASVQAGEERYVELAVEVDIAAQPLFSVWRKQFDTATLDRVSVAYHAFLTFVA